MWTAHNLTPHDQRPEVYDPIYQRGPTTADGVIHHSAWGRDRMLARYRFRPDCRHEVIPHGHFGDLWPGGRTPDRAPTAEARLGLAPARLRIGLVGAPRADKLVGEFLRASPRAPATTSQVVCWSLGLGETAPDDPRIAIAEPYRDADEATYSTRLAACDVLALPFDPTATCSPPAPPPTRSASASPRSSPTGATSPRRSATAGIRVGHTAGGDRAALDALTPERLDAAARPRCDALRPRTSGRRSPTRTADLFERVVLDEP